MNKISEIEYQNALIIIGQYKEQQKALRISRTPNIGDVVKAKCTAIGRYIGFGRVLYIGAMCNNLCTDNIDMEADWTNYHNLPLPTLEEVKKHKFSPSNSL